MEQDIDVTKVSLASVCEQYLVYLSLMEALDLDVASEYLVIAATLVFIKSKRLLPPPPEAFDDLLGDEAMAAEEALRARLIAYQHFKLASRDLKDRLDVNSAYYIRPDLPVDGIVQRYKLDVRTLAAAFATAIDKAEARPALVKRETFSVVVKMNYVLRLARDRGTLSFFELVDGCSMLEVVVTFLAVLELVRSHKLVYDQRGRFDDIVLTPVPRGAITDGVAQSA